MSVYRFRHILYTPEDDAKGALDTLPKSAKKSIDVEIYGLTDMDLIDALLEAARRGVAVRLNNDRTQSAGAANHAALKALVNAKLPNIAVKVTMSEKDRIDHLKLIVIDGVDGALADTSVVAYGSYNFSDSASLQDNVFVLTNDPGEVARAILKFDHDWSTNKSKPDWQVLPD